MFCFHKFGNVDNGYQYCKKCNKAIPVSLPKCSHKWEIIDKYSRVKYNFQGEITSTTGFLYILQCSECGDIKEKNINRN